MATQKEIDAQTGLHNTTGYDQTGSRISGGQVDNFNTPTPPVQTPVNSQTIAPATPFNVQQPAQTPPPDITGLDAQIQDINAQFAPLPQQPALSAAQQRIMDLTNTTSQEGAVRSSLEADPALQAKRQTVQDLTSQVNALIAENKSIPLTIQQQATGRGVTAGGVAPIQIAQQRENAIKALSTSSLLSAAQGNLTLALDQIDRSVKAQFEPQKAELDALIKNYDLMLKDPALSQEEARRAAIAKATTEAKQKELATKEENTKSIQALALQAQQNGAPAPILSRIMGAKTLEEALTASVGYGQKETVQSIQEYSFAKKNGYAGSFSQYQNEDANRKAVVARAGVANGEFGLSQGQANLFNNIITKYNASPLIAAADRTIVLKNSIEQARKNPSDGATQLNLVYSYIQALDTYQSAVREGELGLVNSIDSKIGALSNSVSQIQNGQIVRPEVAKQIADAADNLVNTINQGAKSKAKSFESQANTLGLGDPWKKYQSGFQSSFADKTPKQKVDEAVQSAGKTYQQIISGAPAGQIAVVQDGVAGYIPVEEFDPNTQVKM